jgi:hypothetical protein
MALSELAICNLALIALGEDVVTSLDDNRNKAARLCKAAFPMVRDAVTARVPWACAGARATLAADSVAPAFQWQFSYTLPADFLRLRDIYENQYAEWETEGGKLLTNESAPLRIRYTRRLDDVTQIDAQLAEAISLALAGHIGPSLTQNESATQRCLALYEQRVRLAANTSAQQHSVVEWDSDVWLRARFR